MSVVTSSGQTRDEIGLPNARADYALSSYVVNDPDVNVTVQTSWESANKPSPPVISAKAGIHRVGAGASHRDRTLTLAVVPVTARLSGEGRYPGTFRQRPSSLTTCPSRLRSPLPIIFVVKNHSCPNPESPTKPLNGALWRRMAQKTKTPASIPPNLRQNPLRSARHGPGNTALRWRTSRAAALDLVCAQPSPKV